MDTSPDLARALGALAAQLADALAGSASGLLRSLHDGVGLLRAVERQLDAGVAASLCELVGRLRGAWLLGAGGAALLAVAALGCRLAASADIWHFYTLMPLTPLLANVPALGRTCARLAALVLALALVAGDLAHATVAGAGAAARPLLGPRLCALLNVQALLAGPLSAHLAVYLLGLTGPLLVLLLALAAWRRGRTVLARRAAYPAWPFASALAWAAHSLLTALRTLLAQLLGLAALLLTLAGLLALGGACGALAASAPAVRALQASAASGDLALQIDGYAASAGTFLEETAPLLEAAHTIARGFVGEEPLLAVYQVRTKPAPPEPAPLIKVVGG